MLDHQPPHFHAVLGDRAVQIDIAELKILSGSLPRSALRRVLDWASENQELLTLAWAQFNP